MAHDFVFHREFAPLPPETEDVFAVYEVAQDFHQETQLREAFANYCRWYDRIAEQNRQEFAAMQNDINILRWFYRS